MCSYKIEKCSRCGSKTHTHIGHYDTIEELQKEMGKGLIRCFTCLQNGDYHTEFDVTNEKGRIVSAGTGNMLLKAA